MGIEPSGFNIVMPLLIKDILEHFLRINIKQGAQNLYSKVDITGH